LKKIKKVILSTVSLWDIAEQKETNGWKSENARNQQKEIQEKPWYMPIQCSQSGMPQKRKLKEGRKQSLTYCAQVSSACQQKKFKKIKKRKNTSPEGPALKSNK